MLNNIVKTTLISCVAIVSLSTSAVASTISPELLDVANKWAKISFVSTPNKRKEELKLLRQEIDSLAQKFPENENVLTWKGIVSATYAGEIGGLKALKIVKQAKKHFELAMTLNEDALEGGARTSLGALYYQVPGWPIGFGIPKKAEKLLKESAKRFPENINALYFLGNFLLDQKRYKEALETMQAAQRLKPRDLYELADYGRLNQIEEAIAEIRKNL